MAVTDDVERRLQRLESVAAIERLQNIYGYYLDENRADDILDLFVDDGRMYFRGGVFVGRAGLERFYKQTVASVFGYETTGPRDQTLASHFQIQPVVDVADDGRTARGRFNLLQLTLVGDDRAGWSSAIYDTELVLADGRWAFASLRYTHLWSMANWPGSDLFPAPPGGAAGPPPLRLFPDDPLGPDEVDERPMHLPYPSRAVVPVHFANPVSGKVWELGLPQTESR